MGLAIANKLTWKKKLRIMGVDDSDLGALECRDQHKGPYWFDWPPEGQKIEFGKDIGPFMTGVYWIQHPDLDGVDVPAFQLLFIWEKD